MRKLILFFCLIALPTEQSFAAVDIDPLQNGYINCGSGATLDGIYAQGGGGMTISAWINPDSSGEGSYGQIVNKTQGAKGWEFGMNNNAQRIYFYHYCAGTDVTRDTNSLLTSGVMNHVLVTWDGSMTAANIHIYINGTEATYVTTTNGTTSVTADTTESLCIGSYDANGNYHFDGRIEEVAVWNRVLTAQEIANLASSRVRGMPLQFNSASSLKGYWPMQECAPGATCSGSSQFIDYSGNGNHGTATNSSVGFPTQVLSSV